MSTAEYCRVLQVRVKQRIHQSNMASVGDTVGSGEAVVGGAEKRKMSYVEEAEKLQEKTYRFMAKQTHPVIIPSYASWFDLCSVHQIEKDAVPDFFNGSSPIYKTPQSYMEARNFMVNTFRLAPYEYLTITAVRRNLTLDVASVMKIHSLLENWGLINYQVDPRAKQTLRGKKYFGNYKTVLDVPESLQPHLTDENMKDVAVDISVQMKQYNSTNDYNLLVSNHNSHSLTKPKIYVCFTCGNDIGQVMYHNLRAKEMNICSRCFKEGHFSSNFQASDFIKLNNVNNMNDKIWTDEELLLLLEGIELYEDKWDKIADHVGHFKTVEECVQKFLILPIEDRFIRDTISSETKRKNVGVSVSQDNISAFKDLIENNASEPVNPIENETYEKLERLTTILVEKITDKLSVIDEADSKLIATKGTFFKDSEKLLNDKISLNKQTIELNNELKSKKIYKTIKSSNSKDIHLVLKDNSEIRHEQELDSSHLSKLVSRDSDAVSIRNSEAYRPLVL